MEEENFLSKALRIIGDELPKFFTETNTPFLGKDEEQSVMKAKSSGQQEKEIVEGLLTAGAMVPMAGKAASKVLGVAAKSPVLTSAITALGMQDPTALLSGPIGLADAISSLTGGGGAVKNAEATIVPANLIKDSGIIANALSMLKKGLDPKAVFKQTGVYQGPLDMKPRAVISDENATLLPFPTDKTRDLVLSDIFSHPDLYKAVPDLKNLRVYHMKKELADQGYKGMYVPADGANKDKMYINPKASVEDIISTILHEGQHKIQGESNFVGGANFSATPEHPEFSRLINKALEKESLFPSGGNFVEKVQRDIYKRTGGEVEARAVQEMKKLGDAGARSAYTAFPLDFYDVNVKDLLQAVR